MSALSTGFISQVQATTLTFNNAGVGSAETFYTVSHGVIFSGGGLLTEGAAGGKPGQPVLSNYTGSQHIATLSKDVSGNYSDSFFDIWVGFADDVSAVSGDYISNLAYGGTVYAYDAGGIQLSEYTLAALSGSSTTAIDVLGTFDFGSLTGIRSLHLISSSSRAATMLDNLTFTASPVPVPAAVWLFGSGIMGLFGAARMKKA